MLADTLEQSAPKSTNECRKKPALKRPNVGGKAVTEDQLFKELTAFGEERESRKKQKIY